MFSGLLFCGDCKKPMVRQMNPSIRNGKNAIYICSTRNRIQSAAGTVFQTDLKKVVFRIIQSQVELLIDVNQQMQYLQTKEMNFEDVVSGLIKEITRLRNEQEKYHRLGRDFMKI